jgi:hypothetical protein
MLYCRACVQVVSDPQAIAESGKQLPPLFPFLAVAQRTVPCIFLTPSYNTQ